MVCGYVGVWTVCWQPQLRRSSAPQPQRRSRYLPPGRLPVGPGSRICIQHKQMAAIGGAFKNTLRYRRQSIESAPLVRHPGGQPHARFGRHKDQGISSLTNDSTVDRAVMLSTKIRRPSDSGMPTRRAETGSLTAGAKCANRRPIQRWGRETGLF